MQSDVRIIRVPFEALWTQGDLRYNVVIHPGDMIIVPNPMIGEYYMGGHVARVGVYSLTAQDHAEAGGNLRRDARSGGGSARARRSSVASKDRIGKST